MRGCVGVRKAGLSRTDGCDSQWGEVLERANGRGGVSVVSAAGEEVDVEALRAGQRCSLRVSRSPLRCPLRSTPPATETSPSSPPPTQRVRLRGPPKGGFPLWAPLLGWGFGSRRGRSAWGGLAWPGLGGSRDWQAGRQTQSGTAAAEEHFSRVTTCHHSKKEDRMEDTKENEGHSGAAPTPCGVQVVGPPPLFVAPPHLKGEQMSCLQKRTRAFKM